MQALHMLLVTDKYEALAGTGKCTIRKYPGTYYAGLTCGDNVVMHHAVNPDANDEPLATELLQVSAYAISNLDALLLCHARNHHSYVRPACDTHAKLKSHILSFYPVAENQAQVDLDPYIVIYF
jgi:hypothetical protein